MGLYDILGKSLVIIAIIFIKITTLIVWTYIFWKNLSQIYQSQHGRVADWSSRSVFFLSWYQNLSLLKRVIFYIVIPAAPSKQESKNSECWQTTLKITRHGKAPKAASLAHTYNLSGRLKILSNDCKVKSGKKKKSVFDLDIINICFVD